MRFVRGESSSVWHTVVFRVVRELLGSLDLSLVVLGLPLGVFLGCVGKILEVWGAQERQKEAKQAHAHAHARLKMRAHVRVPFWPLRGCWGGPGEVLGGLGAILRRLFEQFNF